MRTLKRFKSRQHVITEASGDSTLNVFHDLIRFPWEGTIMFRIIAAFAALALAGCATTSEMPLAPNIVRLDTRASGALFTNSAGALTMKKAAEATLSRGFTHFRFEQASTSSGSRFVGVTSNTFGTANATAMGNTVYGNYSGTTISTPIYAPTANIGVTVVMFHANEAEAQGAFDAADVLKKGGKV
jgi:hypothetical protein